MRVKVWDGAKEKYLGTGTYVGDVDVYAFIKDGQLLSFADAEQKPETVPEDCQVRILRNNPKIVLDDGKVVYGCQVWWQPHLEVVEVEGSGYDPWAV